MKPPEPSEVQKALEAVFEKTVPDSYAKEWLERVHREVCESDEFINSALVFYIEGYWFAIPSAYVARVFDPSMVHYVPGRTNNVFKGIVNVDGQLELMVSLLSALRAGKKRVPSDAPPQQDRGIVLEFKKLAYAIQADYVRGVFRYSAGELKPFSVPLQSPLLPFVLGELEVREKRVYLLNIEPIFEAFKEGCQ